MIKPGVYDMPLADYLADPAPAPSLSTGIAHALLTKSPKHAWMQHPKLNPHHEREESSRLDFGSIAHALLLEDDPSRVVIVDAEDWRTKAARDERDAAREAGKLPILASALGTVHGMVARAREAIASSEIADDWRDGVAEQTMIWEHEGIWVRSRPDKMTKDGKLVFDFKTLAGSAHPSAVVRAILQHGYDIQQGIARLGVESLLGQCSPVFIFICQEINPPYAVSLVSLDGQWAAFADEKLKMAMSIWKRCLRLDDWPAYPSRVCYVAPPAYAANHECTVGLDAEGIV